VPSKGNHSEGVKKLASIILGPFRMALFKRTVPAGLDLFLSGFLFFHTFSVIGEKVTGERASAVFGATLRRHLHLSNCRNELLWKRSRSSESTVTYSSGDPPCRGAEKTTLVGLPPMTECLHSKHLSPRSRAAGGQVKKPQSWLRLSQFDVIHIIPSWAGWED
jgi:hypothetical protein